MRKKIWTVIFTSALLILLGVVEQKAVRTLTNEAMAQTQTILQLLKSGQNEQGLEQARQMDTWWDEKAPMVEVLINHEATDDVRFTLSRLVAALEGEDCEEALVFARELEGGIEHVLERQVLSVPNLL